MATRNIQVVDSVTVAHYQAVESPTVAEDVNQQAVARAARFAFVCAISTHHFAYITIYHQCFESRQVSFPQVAHRNHSIEFMTKRFRTTMDTIVLSTSVSLVVLVVIALHTSYYVQAHSRHQEGVFTVSLLAASPAWVTEDVYVWCPESQVRNSRYVRTYIAIQWQSVVACTCFVRHHGVGSQLCFIVERCRHSDRLWEYGYIRYTHQAVASFAPPVIGRNAQAFDSQRTVHHHAHLLFLSKQ